MYFRLGMLVAVLSGVCGIAAAAENAFVGQWDLTPANGGAGWLEVTRHEDGFGGSLLWMGGSPEVFTSVYFDGATLNALRVRNDEVRDSAGKVIGTRAHPITVTATMAGDVISGTFAEPAADGSVTHKTDFTGRRTPPIPTAPELSRVTFGAPVPLFNGKNLDGWAVSGGAHWATIKKPDGSAVEGWVPVDEGVTNGWTAKDGVLMNNPVQQEGAPWIRYGNLQTTRDFEDFNLTLEVNVPTDGNSGIYLRGIYEVQVADSFGKNLDRHNMGAIYGRITPSVAAEKPGGEWQSLDITLVDRHATVILNGQIIVDNAPIAGCTGGALWSDQSRPGPIYLQGDHTAVQYRNLILRPVVNRKR